MPHKPPLTSRQVEAIMERAVGSERAYDIAALGNEIDRLSDHLSDCWLLMDAVARGHSEVNRGIPGSGVREVAEALLRKQQCPGWKSK